VRIALDASYSIDKHPSGIAIYSRALLAELPAAYPADSFFPCYRPKQFRRAASPRYLFLPFLTGLLTRPDLFHALNQRLDRRPARNVITTFHDLFVMTSEYATADFRQRFAKQARLAAQHSDLIIAVSEFTASQVHALLGVEKSRIRVVPHGAHISRHKPRVEEKMILTVGAIQLRKNTARLVEAFEALPGDWHLVLAGAPLGYDADRILQRIEASTAKKRIRIAGYVSSSELEDLYSRASIFAFPSLDEGFGIPVLEAMAHGLPVVTSNRSALPEVAGSAALLVDPTDVSAIAAALADLTAHPERRAQLSKAGLARAEGFPWRRAIDETYRVYREFA
jgi:glycosyltransferase involved in cell wall biosynthesis